MEYNREKEIRELLELYFEGSTSVEQDKILQSYFAQSDIPSDLVYVKAMFGHFDTCSGQTTDIEIKLPVEKKRVSLHRKLIYSFTSVAASVAIMFLVMWNVNQKSETIYCYLNGHPVTDIELAREQAQVAMNILGDGIVKTVHSIDNINMTGAQEEVIKSLTIK